MVDASWEDSLAAFNSAIAVFPPHMAGALTAFALLPLVQRFSHLPRCARRCTWLARPAAARQGSPR
ncbi:MAG: hypothetical protein IPK17_35370 [Chloroflexi bacterium]|uniref:hypothetical protein n=1 Tax=Candidatus Flexifilum breve TaxID=3140694 RepID=UPI003136E335|nr:hypothetical protein [Chloroflexota bacterium]